MKILPSENTNVRVFLEKLGVAEEIANLVVSVFPSDSFKEYYSLFTEAINKPASLKNIITQFEIELGLGLTSHIAIVAREMLGLSNFSMFTRDYIKRCGDLVEHFLKTRLVKQLSLAGYLPSASSKRSLGSIVYSLRKDGGGKLPLDLLDGLRAFDLVVYRPAKHVFGNSGKPLFSVQDAVAVTFVSIRLCQRIEQAAKTA